jgi:hypothetical protein
MLRELHEPEPSPGVQFRHIGRVGVLDDDNSPIPDVRHSAGDRDDLLDAGMTAIVNENVDGANIGQVLCPKLRVCLIADDDFESVRLEPFGRRLEIDPDDSCRRSKIAAPRFQRAAITNTNLDEGKRPSAVLREEAVVNRQEMGPLGDTTPYGAEVQQQGVVSHRQILTNAAEVSHFNAFVLSCHVVHLNRLGAIPHVRFGNVVAD